MSTKIYNAYKYRKSIDKLMSHIIDYRIKWTDWQINRLHDLLVGIRDMGSGEKHAKLFDKEFLLCDAVDAAIKTDNEKMLKTHFDVFDVSGSVVVYFHKKNIYVQTFLEPCYTNFGKPPEFLTNDMVDFHYQNQTDPSYVYMDGYKSFSPKKKKSLELDWNNRKKVWDDIFNDKAQSFSEAGLTYEMTPSSFLVTYKLFDLIRDKKILQLKRS